MTGIGPFSTLHDSAQKIFESRVMTWIGELLDLNLAEHSDHFCQHVDTLIIFLLGHSGIITYPHAAVPHIYVSI